MEQEIRISLMHRPLPKIDSVRRFSGNGLVNAHLHFLSVLCINFYGELGYIMWIYSPLAETLYDHDELLRAGICSRANIDIFSPLLKVTYDFWGLLNT